MEWKKKIFLHRKIQSLELNHKILAQLKTLYRMFLHMMKMSISIVQSFKSEFRASIIDGDAFAHNMFFYYYGLESEEFAWTWWYSILCVELAIAVEMKLMVIVVVIIGFVIGFVTITNRDDLSMLVPMIIIFDGMVFAK